MSEPTGIVGEFMALKAETDADYLMMQVGDFYEFFGDDAEEVAALLDLKVSKKSSHGSKYPMAGVPVDKLMPHLKGLVERGYRVAVADQTESGEGHEREITRVVTPGTLLETASADAQYLASVVRAGGSDGGDGDGEGYGLAFADVTTGRFLVTAVDGGDSESAMAAAFTELYRFDPVEVLPGPEVRNDEAFLDAAREQLDASLSVHDPNAFAPGAARHAVREQFGAETMVSIGLDGDSGGTGGDGDAEVRAAGAVLSYVDETGTGVRESMTRLRRYRGDDHVELDATTQRNLELTETMHGDRSGSLFDTIDHTETSPGRRLLKEWLQRPRRARDVLERRQRSVAALAESALAREQLRETLDGAYDLARLASRAAHGSADATDLLRVRDTLALLPAVADAIAAAPGLADSPLAAIAARPDREAAAALREELAEALAEDPPNTVTQGGLFRHGYDDDLDELIERHDEAKAWLDSLADREKREHGITHLQVDRNKTDGYYIQVGNSETDEVPDRYRRVKTLKNSERYTTDELDEREREILRLEEQRGDLEYELFEDLRDRVADRAGLLQAVGRTLAEIDVLAGLAVHAVENDWTRPDLREDGSLDVEAGRHPVVEQTTEFVPNGVRLTDDRRFLVVTGPNMSGKSTYMRQVALIALLAQVGSFVPARSATVGLVDGIYTRVGALDELAQGRSTFMVEMQELSNILHSASADSLVILDEVGRGTATYDGISIAWAATEYIHNEVQAKTLFATHYHELTGLADRLPGVENVHVAVDGEPPSSGGTASRSADESRGVTDGDVTFLRTVEDGPTNRSYGIHVADLAGVPDPVVERSGDVLRRLREDEAIDVRGGSTGDGTTEQVVFDLGSGQFKQSADADGRDADSEGRGSEDGSGEGGSGEDGSGESVDGEDGSGESVDGEDGSGEDERGEEADAEAAAVLDELRAAELHETSPVELMGRVQEWQRRLRDD